jgi:ribosomal protein S7
MVYALRPSGYSEFYLHPQKVTSSKASALLTRIFMRHGKYQQACRFGSTSLFELSRLFRRRRPARVLLETIRIIRPLISFSPQRMGRIILSLPAPVKSLVSFKAAIRILLRSASKRFEKGVVNRFFREVFDTFRGRSGSFSESEKLGQIVTRNYHLISRFRARKYASRRFPLARYNRGFLAYEFRRFLPRVRFSRRRSSSIFQRRPRPTRASPFLLAR